jgi:hypothetical protein
VHVPAQLRNHRGRNLRTKSVPADIFTESLHPGPIHLDNTVLPVSLNLVRSGPRRWAAGPESVRQGTWHSLFPRCPWPTQVGPEHRATRSWRSQGKFTRQGQNHLSQNHDDGELPAWLAALQLLRGAARVGSPLRSFTRQRTDDVQ